MKLDKITPLHELMKTCIPLRGDCDFIINWSLPFNSGVVAAAVHKYNHTLYLNNDFAGKEYKDTFGQYYVNRNHSLLNRLPFDGVSKEGLTITIRTCEEIRGSW